MSAEVTAMQVCPNCNATLRAIAYVINRWIVNS